MKNFKCILLTFLLALTIGACRSVRSVSEINKETKSKERTSVKKDSTNVVERNQAINNEYTIPLKTADSLTNERIKQALANFKAGAKSGSNSTRIVFDEDVLALKVAAIVGETKSQTTSVNLEVATEQTLEEKTDAYISKKLKSIPFWTWIIVVFWLLPQIIERIKLVVLPFLTFLRK